LERVQFSLIRAATTNTTGSSNTAIGPSALGAVTGGVFNTAIGSETLSSTLVSNSTAVGAGSIQFNQSGNYNTAVGAFAGSFWGEGSTASISANQLQTGENGVYIGYYARGSTFNQTNEIVIGANAVGGGSNTAVIGATSQVSATVYGLFNAPSGVCASGATFSGQVRVNGNLFANNIVNALNGFTGGVTLAAGTGITFTASSGTITLASTASGGSTNTTTQTLDFSSAIDHIEVEIVGGGDDFGTSLQYIENNTNIITFDTGSASAYTAVLDSIQSFYDVVSGAWAARIRLKPPFGNGTSTTAEGILGEAIIAVYIDSTSSGGANVSDFWTNITSQTLLHKQATQVVKTVTGQTWVTAGSYIECKVLGLTTADHTPEDAILEGVRFEIDNIVAGTGFDIIGHAPEGTYGKYSVKCLGQ